MFDDEVVGEVVARAACRRSDTKPTTIRKLRADLATWTPCCCTACGSSGSASCSLFCTCTCAMSGLVPASKVSVTDARPSESDDELM